MSSWLFCTFACVVVRACKAHWGGGVLRRGLRRFDQPPRITMVMISIHPFGHGFLGTFGAGRACEE